MVSDLQGEAKFLEPIGCEEMSQILSKLHTSNPFGKVQL